MLAGYIPPNDLTNDNIVLSFSLLKNRTNKERNGMCDFLTNEIGNSAIAGVIAALTATVILGIAKWIRDFHARRRDVAYIREILTDGRKRVYEAKDTRHVAMDTSSQADYLRAAQYNNMAKSLDVALKNWTPGLFNVRKKAIFDALDWYHTDGLLAIKVNNKPPVWVEPPEGKWPTSTMSLDAAKSKFEKIEAIRWLRMKTY